MHLLSMQFQKEELKEVDFSYVIDNMESYEHTKEINQVEPNIRINGNNCVKVTSFDERSQSGDQVIF